MSSDTKISALEGKYKRQGQKLLPEMDGASHYFIIGSRKKTTGKKAQQYLVLFRGNEKRYFSSLYPSHKNPNEFFAECEGEIFSISINLTNMTLKKRGDV